MRIFRIFLNDLQWKSKRLQSYESSGGGGADPEVVSVRAEHGAPHTGP